MRNSSSPIHSESKTKDGPVLSFVTTNFTSADEKKTVEVLFFSVTCRSVGERKANNTYCFVFHVDWTHFLDKMSLAHLSFGQHVFNRNLQLSMPRFHFLLRSVVFFTGRLCPSSSRSCCCLFLFSLHIWLMYQWTSISFAMAQLTSIGWYMIRQAQAHAVQYSLKHLHLTIKASRSLFKWTDGHQRLKWRLADGEREREGQMTSSIKQTKRDGWTGLSMSEAVEFRLVKHAEKEQMFDEDNNELIW